MSAKNIDINLLQPLDSLYIDARYPGNLGLLPEGKPSIEDAKSFYKFAKDILSKIKPWQIILLLKRTPEQINSYFFNIKPTLPQIGEGGHHEINKPTNQLTN